MNAQHLFLIAAMALFVGCNPPATDTKTDTGAGGEAAHNHPTEGPHGGALIELGNEEYHGEFLHNDAAGTVTIYILDSSATKEVAIDATEVTINMKHGDHAHQYKLAAEADASGKASKFVSIDAELAEGLDGGAEGSLVASIDGTNYNGAIPHHDHDGDGHEGHDDHAGHDHDGEDAHDH